MTTSWLIHGLALVLLMPRVASAEPPKQESKAVTIPLKEIWANQMPDTRDIEELAKKQIKLTRRDLWSPIVNSIGGFPWRPRDGQPAKPGFVVEGVGLEAFRAAHLVLTGNEEPRRAISHGKQASLVFFSQPVQAGVELQKVELRDNLIELRYRFVSRMETYQTTHLALIPIANLPLGIYEVKVIQMPSVYKHGLRYVPVERPINAELARRKISRSFSFEVTGERSGSRDVRRRPAANFQGGCNESLFVCNSRCNHIRKFHTSE
jgi:hypothetical protein